jgi:GntR family transcriptional regulator
VTEPMYRQVADDLGHQIESGELAPGDQLKSEVELREVYGQDGMVSRNTVRDAIKLLVARGLVETRPGQGTFVVKKVQPFVTTLTTDPEAGGIEDEVYKSEVERQGRNPEETLPRVEVQAPSELVAAQLELGKGAQVISRHQERRIDGNPWSLQTTFYPMEFVTREGGVTQLLMAQNFKEGLVKLLEAGLHIKQVGWRDTIIARPPEGTERVFFGLSDKVQVAIFEFRRTSYDQDGEPIRFTVTVYPADRNQFEMVAGQVPSAINL